MSETRLNMPILSVEKTIKSLSDIYCEIVKKGISPKVLPSVMLWGPPGVGKSQAIRQIAKNIKKETGKETKITDVRLLLFNPIDLRGIPTANADKTLAIWLKPQIFQMDPSDDIVNILFLDEISAAPQSVQAAAYQITLDRVVGEHKLPDNCIVIAAGNRVTDKSVSFKMPKALANRLLHIEVEGSFESWQKWAVKSGVNPKVMGFLAFRTDKLFGFDPKSDDLAFATPRSWEMVSNLLNNVCDNILYSFGMDIKRITLKNFGVAMHKTPSGKHGYKFTVEQVYDELLKAKCKFQDKKGASKKGGEDRSSCDLSADEKSGQSNSDTEKDDKGKDGNNPKDNETKDNENEMEKALPGAGGENGGITDDDLNGLIASLLKGRATYGKIDPNTEIKKSDMPDENKQGKVDDHSFWNGDEEDNIGRDTWLNRMIEATDIIASSKGGKDRGIIPLAAERIIEELKNPTLDWKTILNDFAQEEICDYSFSPPDKRMEDSPFFLPDFNEKDENVKDILFMIDTSGSMSDRQINECYSEIYGAIQQFGGKLQGKLGFFDAVVVEPIPFEDEEEFKIIRPFGGGGTSFDIIFDYVEEKMQDEPPVSIVILTDGCAPFPEESRANGIPVLWIINNNEVSPPWGKIARILDNAPY